MPYNWRMYVCILAAGRGTRMGELTETTPKPLLSVGGVPILLRTLGQLPAATSRVLIIVGYRGDQIQAAVGDSFSGIPVRYFPLESLGGTAHALYQAAPELPGKEPFLVLNGDDLYHRDDLERIIRYPLALGFKPSVHPAARYLHVGLTPDGMVAGLAAPTPEQDVVNVATGAYVLDARLFSFEPVRMKSGELGLPHTVASMAGRLPVHGVAMERWFPLTTPEDFAGAEAHVEEFHSGARGTNGA
jgi:bifunctional UDP-N-acetylglucosamine pyrophosphorylase/glucosamine-1-phosphate N-acetyltransferase